MCFCCIEIPVYAILSVTMKNHTGKRRFTIKLLSLMFLMVQEISISQALPQRGTSNEPPISAGNVAREASDDAKAAKTVPRKVDTRMEPPKVNPTSTRTTTKEEKKDDSVKFPTNRPSNGGNVNTRNKITDELVPDPRDVKKCEQSFRDCEKFSYYPTNVVEKLLLEGKINKNLLVNEIIKKNEVDTRLEGSGDDGSGKKQFCSYKEEIFYPDGGKNKDGEYRFVVQLPKYNITQGIRTETCVSGDNSCGGLKTHLPSYYQLECVQKYAYKQLVTFSASGTVQEPIEIPSCCVCMYSDKK